MTLNKISKKTPKEKKKKTFDVLFSAEFFKIMLLKKIKENFKFNCIMEYFVRL